MECLILKSVSTPRVVSWEVAPAGIMSGYLLAQAGVQVTVIEKHGDFLRDFRDLLDEFLQLPHHKSFPLAAHSAILLSKAPISGTCRRARYIALMQA
jgi:hypothetical protein